MRVKNYFLPLFFIIIFTFLLDACNLRVLPNPNLAPALSVETSVVLTVTALSASLPTPTLTPTLSPVPSVTFTPSPTPTLMFASTATSTQQWSACPGIVVTRTDTDAGDMLHVLRCEDGLQTDFGPLAKGTYAVSPNNKFLIYVGFNGVIYSAKIGDRYLFPVFNLKHEKVFTVFNKTVDPNFVISFVGDEPNYKLVLLEKTFDQKRVYNLPPQVTQ